MSVDTALGITREMAEEIAARRWGQWLRDCPGLAATTPAGLHDWLRTAGVETVGVGLYELARLAAADGGDDRDAACVLAWAMLPVAARVAIELRDLGPDIDALVVSQLWLAIRTFNWRGSTKFVGNLSCSLRRDLLREHQRVGVRLARDEVPLDPFALEYLDLEALAPAADPRQRLLSVLDWGVENGTIQPSDRELLLDLVEDAARDPKRHSPRRSLLGSSASVGSKWGITARSVRRRGRRALDALASRSAEYARESRLLAS